MEDDVRNWLKSFGLQEYEDQFEKDGWEKLDDILHIDEYDLHACIHKPGHRKIFQLAIQEIEATGMHPSVKIKETNNENSDPNDDENFIDSRAKDVEYMLRSIGLGLYVSKFKEEGWDRLEVVNDMDEQDVCSCIDKPGHRKKFQIAHRKGDISSFSQISSESRASVMPDESQEKEDVKRWLEENNLEQYCDRLVDEGWDTLEVLFEIGDNEEDLKTCIGKPGHRKRFQRAVNIEMSKRNHDTSPKVKLSEERDDIQITQRKDIAYLQDASRDIQSDLSKVCGEFAPSQTQPLDKAKGSDKENSAAESTIVINKADELEQRQTVSQKENSSPGRTAFREQPVKFGLSFEENEAQSTTELFDDQELDSVEGSSTRGDFDKDSSEAETSEESDTGTMDTEAKHLRRTYSLPPIPSQIFINKTKNLAARGGTIINVSKKTFSTDAKKKYRNRYRKQMKTALEVSKKKDSFFVETRAYKELEKKVKNNHWGVITGIPGDGKTSMAGHLSLKYLRKGYEYLELHFARDWKDWVDSDKGKKQFILIDDIFGQMSIDKRKVSEWSSIIDLMQKVVQQRQGKLKVVCTSRKYVFEDVKTKLAQFTSFQEPAVIDITQNAFALTKDEKLQMWSAYEGKFETTMPHSFVDEETEEGNAPHGFPHCVDLYFSSPSLQNEEGFFDNPMQCINKELVNFKDNDKFKYCALLLVLLNGNKLEDVFIEKETANEPGFKPLVSAAGLQNCPTSNDMKQALKGLRGTYITEIDGCYSISHDSIRENLALVFIEQTPKYAINNMQFEYLTEHTRCSGQTSSDNPHSHLMCTLKSQYNDDLVKRMLQEIKRGNVVTVCAHQAWDNKAFVHHLIQYLLRMYEESNLDQHGYTCIDYVFNTKDCSTSYIFDHSLFDALGFFGHEDAVQQMTQSKLGPIIDHMPGLIEIPKENPLPLHLHTTMDKIGASPVLREFQIYSAISMELLDTVCAWIAGEKFRCYIFGSHSEGTRIITHIPKRDCDVNYLFSLRDIEVVQSLSEIKPDQNIQYLLAVTDAITRPGYVKLQIIINGVPQTGSTESGKTTDTARDHQDRIVLCKRRPDKIHVDEIKGLNVTTDIVTGTATEHIGTQTTAQRIVTGTEYEIYHSFRCRSWPQIATKWISRNRHYNWPSRSVIEQIKSLGVFLVPVGSQGSIEKNLEWKILFLLQERKLMSILNDTQYKCYIILKMINNDIISNRFEEPILVSYHLKTCLFYIIESTEETIWQPENLLQCVQICLKHILKCATKGSCPNYFIPQDNMFYRRIRGEVQTQLKSVLIDLLACKDSLGYFKTITCGNLGPRLEQEILGKTETVLTDQDLVPSPVRLYLKLIKFLSLVKMRILYKCYNINTEKCCIQFEEAVNQLQKAEEIIDHSKEQTEKAFALVLPYIELSLMSVRVASQIENSKESDTVMPLLTIEKWEQIDLLIQPRLKLATFLHMCGQIDASLQVLQSLKQSMYMYPNMLSVCGCQYHHTIVDDETKRGIKDMPEPQFRKNMCVSCVAFLPTEQNAIPAVLVYEMKRSKVLPQSNSMPTFHFWYDWAVVDGKVLLCLIEYLNYKTISQRSHLKCFADIKRQTDNVIKELQNTINDDPNLGHKDTGLNILGWIYREEGDMEEAERCFRESLEKQSAYNAANLHMEELMYIGY